MKFRNEEDALVQIISDAWELSNKPHRFFSTVRSAIEQFYMKYEERMHLDENGLEETLSALEEAEKIYYKGII